MLTLSNLANVEKIVFDYYLDFLLYISHTKEGISLMAIYDHNDFDQDSYNKLKEELYEFVHRVKTYEPNLLKDPGQLGIDFLMLRNFGQDNITKNIELYGEDIWWLHDLCKSYKPVYLFEKDDKVFLR